METLRILDIGECKDLPGSAVQEVMCTLVNIVSFKPRLMYD